MDENKKIAVYYIATGDYKRLFPEFLDSLQNFFPEWDKVVKVISDGLEKYKDYQEGNVRVELCPRINDYPWPVVTLYKMWHVLQNYDETCDYACFMNGNATVYPHSLDVFDFDKITVSYHSFNGKNRPYDPFKHININPDSIAYLENGTYEYVQGGFFFGKNDAIRDMCRDITKLVFRDTNRLMIAQWHDESYLNKWCVDHADKVDKKYIMTVYKEDLDEERFIYLRDKNNYDIKRVEI